MQTRSTEQPACSAWRKARSFSVATLVLLGAAGLLGCNGQCDGQSVGAPFAAGTGKTLAVECISFSGGGQPLGVHIPMIEFVDGTILELHFPVEQPVPAELDLSIEDGGFGAHVVNFRGFEGGSQNICDFTPKNSAVAGKLSLTALTPGDDGLLDEMHGSVEASFTGCTIASLGLVNAPLTLKGSF